MNSNTATEREDREAHQECIETWTSAARERLYYAEALVEQIETQSRRQATKDAANQVWDILEAVQEDLNEIADTEQEFVDMAGDADE